MCILVIVIDTGKIYHVRFGTNANITIQPILKKNIEHVSCSHNSTVIATEKEIFLQTGKESWELVSQNERVLQLCAGDSHFLSLVKE